MQLGNRLADCPSARSAVGNQVVQGRTREQGEPLRPRFSSKVSPSLVDNSQFSKITSPDCFFRLCSSSADTEPSK